MALHCPGTPVLVEHALRHPGEKVDHRVHTVILITLQEVDDFGTIREEISVQKPIHQEHLTWTVEKLMLSVEIQ
jgi:hypothetical protein